MRSMRTTACAPERNTRSLPRSNLSSSETSCSVIQKSPAAGMQSTRQRRVDAQSSFPWQGGQTNFCRASSGQLPAQPANSALFGAVRLRCTGQSAARMAGQGRVELISRASNKRQIRQVGLVLAGNQGGLQLLQQLAVRILYVDSHRIEIGRASW